MLSLKPTVVRESDLQKSADTPSYDYCRVSEESKTHKQTPETMYATVANGGKNDYHSIENAGIGQYDCTVIYEDPTSPSYVVCVQALDSCCYYCETFASLQSEVYSSGSVFDTIGTYVPTLVSRITYNGLFTHQTPYLHLLCIN